MCACEIEYFSLNFGKWDVSWPGRAFKSTTIQLPMTFHLKLAKGSTRKDCRIGQEKLGDCFTASGGNTFGIWTNDGSSLHGGGMWWDGTDWWGGGTGITSGWSVLGEEATFFDKPGFDSVPLSDYPLYYGGVGRKEHFRFRTFVEDKDTRKRVAELTWGLLIDYSAPQQGKHLWFWT